MTKTHRNAGNIRTKEYRAWIAMRERCYYEKHVVYRYYGGRGITVCDRWRNSFENFLEDMGPAPSEKHTVDREHSDDNYEPGKCHWSTQKEQNRNKRSNRIVVYEGQEMCLSEACEKAGARYHMVKKRLNRGWDFDRAISESSSR